MRPRKPLAEPDSPDVCYHVAVRVLELRWHGEAELSRKLSLKGFTPEAIEATFQRLRREKWLDDDRFAEAFTRTRARRGVGRQRIERELRATGLGDAVVRNAVSTIDAEDEEGRLLTLTRKRMTAQMKRGPVDWNEDEAARKKLFGYLLNQGYDYGAIAAAVRQVTKEWKEQEVPC